MQIYYDDEGEKKPIKGSFLKKYVVRTDLVPVPVTLEFDVRVDADSMQYFKEDKKIYVDDDEFKILKSTDVSSSKVQGDNLAKYIEVIAVISAVTQVCFVSNRAIKKLKTSLADIYRAVGCKVQRIVGDFIVPSFHCQRGDAPSFQIAAILQESAGVMRWHNRGLEFISLNDLFTQEPVADIPIVSADSVVSGFLERHEIPSFYSIDENGDFIYGNQEKARTACFVPNKNALTLKNMSTCLVLKQISRISYNENINAGDLVPVDADKNLIVITAAHVFSAGVDGDPPRQYTKLWLGDIHK